MSLLPILYRRQAEAKPQRKFPLRHAKVTSHGMNVDTLRHLDLTHASTANLAARIRDGFRQSLTDLITRAITIVNPFLPTRSVS